MYSPVELAGFCAHWRFEGSRALYDWFKERPWLSGGGTRALRVGSSGSVAPIADAVRRAVRWHDDGASSVRTLVGALNESTATPLASICEALEVAPDPSRRTTIHRLAQVLDHHPAVVVLDASESSPDAVACLDPLESLVDELPKVHAPAALVALVLGREFGLREADDFSHGEPIEGPWLYLGDRSRSWRSYVHVRISWETAGDIDRAKRWGADAPSFRVGEDGALEAWLNRQSAAELHAQPAGVAAKISALNTRSSDHDDRAELAAAGALWSPSPGVARRPTPWAARALLTAGAPPTRALRRALVCAPLAHELLRVCLDQEHLFRSRHRTPGTPSENTVGNYDRYVRGEAGSDRDFYPPGCPAVTDDPWDFASLGEFIPATGVSGDVRRAVHDLRALRNALAHGHYVSWRGVSLLAQIREAVLRA